MKRMIAIPACGASLAAAGGAQEVKWTAVVDGRTMGDFKVQIRSL